MRFLVVLLVLFSGCVRYNNIWKKETITDIDRNCYNNCKVKHYQCLAYNRTKSTVPCDRMEEYCAKNCMFPTTVIVPDYDKMKLLSKCGPPSPGVDEHIFWEWCRRGLLQ
jgi:hypothetical protein